MKNETTRKFSPPRTACLLLTAAVLMTGFVPTEVFGQINGTINGGTATGNFGDDSITSTTIGISYFTYCPWVPIAVANDGFNAYNFVFAGQGVASAIPNIASSDFTVSQYAPWVGNNNNAMNGVIGPNTTNYNRNLTGQEAGGANILISYKPTAGTDPTSINFLQVYTLNYGGNGGASFNTNVDNGISPGPFYNQGGVGGVGNVATNTVPLVTSSSNPGWLLDIPYINEFGYDPKNQVDDTVTNATDYFQTFISSQVNIGGTNYNVLYGGIQWGFTFSTVDLVPEPTTLALGAGFLGAAMLWRLRRNRRG